MDHKTDIKGKKRHYDDGCAVAQVMDIIGERWALFVIRELLFGPRRFSDLRANLPGISANVLTQRLEGLEAAGIVTRRRLPPPASAQVYDLTDWGREAEPLFRVIGKWAARSPRLTPAWMSAASVVLSMRTMFDAGRAGDMRARIGFRFPDGDFVAEIADGAFTIGPGEAEGADVIVTGDQNLLVAALYGGVPLSDVAAQGLVVAGDASIMERFVGLFPLPDTAPAGARA